MSKRKRARRRLRKQHRRLTPPLLLRNESGERELIEVDHELVTRETLRSTRTTALLILAPELRIQVSSRCINKRRVPVLKISPKDHVPTDWQPSAYRDTLREFAG